MKFIEEFRDSSLAQGLALAIRKEADPARTKYNLMEFCGGHTHAIFRHGIPQLLPVNVRMIHGPGCPVCVLPVTRVDAAIELCMRPEVILCTYGDLMRVPGSEGDSLLKAQARGAKVKMIYSSADAVRIAEENPGAQVIFFAIGFETTAPGTALAIREAHRKKLKNFTVFCNHVLTPSAISNILESAEVRKLGLVQIDGFVGPAHVSAVIGSKPYEYFADEYQRPVVIAGFEPLDVMQAILMLVRQINRGEAKVENQYTRVVTREGNLKAQEIVAEIFELRREFEWRGLGVVPYSGLQIKTAYAEFDAEKRFTITRTQGSEPKGCECGAVIRGIKEPYECKLFGAACTPENPRGSCMVSSEGACAAYYSYGRFVEGARA